MRKNTFLFLLLIFTSYGAFSQSGTLKGKVTDASTGETIPMANIVVKLDGATIIAEGQQVTPEPFVGTPHTVDESTVEPFTGTPHRLDDLDLDEMD